MFSHCSVSLCSWKTKDSSSDPFMVCRGEEFIMPSDTSEVRQKPQFMC
uniref:Uncharacterized protein n=1 Tax=Rhizophora mucronata TaxID=61149 RepID=A0A2P2QCN0_RHIMU